MVGATVVVETTVMVGATVVVKTTVAVGATVVVETTVVLGAAVVVEVCAVTSVSRRSPSWLHAAAGTNAASRTTAEASVARHRVFTSRSTRSTRSLCHPVAACVDHMAASKDKPISPVRLHLRFGRHQADAENDGQQQNAHAYPPQNDACNRHPPSSD